MAGVGQSLFTHYLEELTCRMKLPLDGVFFNIFPANLMSVSDQDNTSAIPNLHAIIGSH